MELALYCPVYGYYEKEGDTPGRRGDYFTSVSVGPLYGELLARKFSQWLAEVRSPGFSRSDEEGGNVAERVSAVKPEPGRGTVPARCLQLVETGAHDGRLARDILGWFREHRAGQFEDVEYCIIEPSETRQERQRTTLRHFAGKVRWLQTPSQLRQNGQGMQGVSFSNELLDSMPIHRFGWDASARKWFEWGVHWNGAAFGWMRLDSASSPARHSIQPPSWPEQILPQLPDGFITELCPAANQWWSESAAALAAGKLITIDYGLAAEECLAPERRTGTLRAYQGHTLMTDVLANPGELDLTAHVNFSAVSQVGEAAGLRTEGLLSQEQFLTGIIAPVFRAEKLAEEWTPERTAQFKTLTHPAHLGRVFRVLIQAR